MNIEHIVSTMNRDEYTFLTHMQMKTPCLVVNQNRAKRYEELSLPNGVAARVVSTPETGLSRSRNMLLKNALGDICIITDDDVEYEEEYQSIIASAYERHPDADIIVFQFTHEKGKNTRCRYKKDVQMHIWNISKAASVEITFKRESVLQAGISFDVLLGLGAEFPSGEENAFLADALRGGLKIYHVPATICFAVEAHSVRGSEEIKGYLETKGASFYRIYQGWFLLFALAFIVLKKRSLLGGISVIKAYSHMRAGRKAYKLARRGA